MKSDLEELIEAYEIEKVELEKQISEYVEEGDYIYAHYHNKALRKINKTLDILKDIQHPFYRLISEEKTKARNMTKILTREEYKKYFDHLGTDFFAERLQEGENKILEWQRAPVSQTYDSQEIDDALFRLVKGVVSNFKLYFKSRPDIYARFTLKDHTIEITLLYDEDPYYDHHGWIFGDGKEIKPLGFILKDEQWIYQYHFDKFKDALEIKILLARLIYDVFNYDRRFDSARIVYDD
ncbi:hypothetical protein [Pedobacter panaciterrae]|uniref:hypothetical protein n=1 Tax=Pedobacter panaciterrae TaxID=363849 RepID=UPI00259AE262|nr:hypothetical protein [uncultured Pedobacter sp.]